MKRISMNKLLQKVSKMICVMILVITFLSFSDIGTVKAEIKNHSAQDEIIQTAYLDMSFVSPLQLHFTEDETDKKADYYYAAEAYQILQERVAMDPMYRNCRQVIVTINKAYTANQIIMTNCEPEVKTGYLNLLSKETHKCYTIDDVTIHIQRD